MTRMEKGKEEEEDADRYFAVCYGECFFSCIAEWSYRGEVGDDTG